MHRFDYSFLEKGNIDTQLLNVTLSVVELKIQGNARKEQYATVFTELEKIAKVQSVKNSNAIEGIVTTDERIREIVTQSSAPLNHSEAEIAGYRDALNLVYNNFAILDFNEQTVLRLHRMMLALTGDVGGTYKTTDNLIMEIDEEGNRRVRFRPVPADETQKAMEQLFLAYADARSNPLINQLLLIPCVILDFLCIHPFSDGNGRMSRLLTLLLLCKNGFDAGRYISYEEQLNKYKELYYEALEQSSVGWHENDNGYNWFMYNFLSMLYLCYKELDKRFAVVNSKRITKKARIEATVLQSVLPISKKEICEILPDVSPTTVEAVLGNLVRNGSVKKIGSGSQTKYYRQ